MPLIKELITHLEEFAPPHYQEAYDNCGLLIGDSSWDATSVLVTLDCTEAVLDEAIAKGCNIIVAHHPIVFKGLKKITGKNYVERTIIKAIKNNIAIYAIHTNLDNIAHGVNAKICSQIGIINPTILLAKAHTLNKVVVNVPVNQLQQVQEAMLLHGAGNIGNYSDCSFYTAGIGSFKGNDNSNAFAGKPNELHTEDEYKLEVIVPKPNLQAVLNAMFAAHPYEEVAYDVLALENTNANVGSGLIGELPNALSSDKFLAHLKTTMQLHVIKYTPISKKIKKVAVCGGAGSFLLNQAIAAGADAFVTADFKYHEFFDAENRLLIADIGHYESEIFTINLIADAILKKMPTFAVILSQTNTNPTKYYY